MVLRCRRYQGRHRIPVANAVQQGAPALREVYKFDDADIEHGERGYQLLEKHCTTREMQEKAIHFARESARMRWFYFDGIFLHYEMGYSLA